MHDGDDIRSLTTDRLPLGPGAEGVSKLLDSLIALRLGIANATEGERALSATAGSANLMEVRAALDRPSAT